MWCIGSTLSGLPDDCPYKNSGTEEATFLRIARPLRKKRGGPDSISGGPARPPKRAAWQDLSVKSVVSLIVPTWGRSSIGRAPASHAGDAGSFPVGSTKNLPPFLGGVIIGLPREATFWAGMFRRGDTALQAACGGCDSHPVHQKYSRAAGRGYFFYHLRSLV